MCSTICSFALFVLLASSLSAVPADSASEATFEKSYPYGPVAFDPNANFSYNIEFTRSRIYMGLMVKDTEVVNADSKENWLGVGVSEATAGGMVGADIVTAEFAEGETNKCNLTDRHVPFAAFPLGESRGSSNSTFPVPDDCQIDESWVLVACKRDLQKGVMTLEVYRTLRAHDTQDRDITAGEQAIIHGYGRQFGYHGSRRGSQRISLFEERHRVLPFDQQSNLPSDAKFLQSVVATRYSVSSDKTTAFACTSAKIDVGASGKRMVVAAEPILNSTKANLVERMTLYVCDSGQYFDSFLRTASCDSPPGRPGGNFASRCRGITYVYSKGSARFVFPPDVGIELNESSAHLILETQYENPDLLTGVRDSSGVRVFLSEKPRNFKAGSLLTGDGFISRRPDVIKTGLDYEHTCPQNCTSKMGETITLFASALSMRSTGRSMYTNKFGTNGSFVATVNQVNFWSKNYQQTRNIPPVTLAPGEALQTTCIYDTAKRPNTKFGLESIDETCMEYIFYYPVQLFPDGQELNACGFYYNRQADANMTICGDQGSLRASVKEYKNPEFEDVADVSSTFGDALSTCAPPEPSVTNDTTSDDPACFPADGLLLLENGHHVRMDALRVGDSVHTGSGVYSEVFMFTHADDSAYTEFIRLIADGHVVRLSKGHMIWADGVLRAAGTVQVGSIVKLGNGGVAPVNKVERVFDKGLYNPHTISGEIVVDDVLVSCYTLAVEARAAHGLLAPMRALYRLFGVGLSVQVG